ncbi:hypothetical protein PR048_025814 [Dryococelus australis]|uniref:Uncharacterized protein n=1 Tax=Dryococelus australis TaxID=614101 RepID=A0ABQ9GJL6_9NEOP|nr:hypothetical protein PR048_025814 [Dryococelus australis]
MEAHIAAGIPAYIAAGLVEACTRTKYGSRQQPLLNGAAANGLKSAARKYVGHWNLAYRLLNTFRPSVHSWVHYTGAVETGKLKGGSERVKTRNVSTPTNQTQGRSQILVQPIREWGTNVRGTAAPFRFCVFIYSVLVFRRGPFPTQVKRFRGSSTSVATDGRSGFKVAPINEVTKNFVICVCCNKKKNIPEETDEIECTFWQRQNFNADIAVHLQTVACLLIEGQLGPTPPPPDHKHKANRVRFPGGGSLPDFRKWESCRTMPLIHGVFFTGSPIFSPALAFRHCSVLTSLHRHRLSGLSVVYYVWKIIILIERQKISVKVNPQVAVMKHVKRKTTRPFISADIRIICKSAGTSTSKSSHLLEPERRKGKHTSPLYKTPTDQGKHTSPLYKIPTDQGKHTSPLYKTPTDQGKHTSPLYKTPTDQGKHTSPLYKIPTDQGKHTSPLYKTPKDQGKHTSPLYKIPTDQGKHTSPLYKIPIDQGKHTSPLYKIPTDQGKHTSPLYKTPTDQGKHTSPLYKTPTDQGKHTSPLYKIPTDQGKHTSPLYKIPTDQGKHTSPLYKTPTYQGKPERLIFLAPTLHVSEPIADLQGNSLRISLLSGVRQQPMNTQLRLRKSLSVADDSNRRAALPLHAAMPALPCGDYCNQPAAMTSERAWLHICAAADGETTLAPVYGILFSIGYAVGWQVRYPAFIIVWCSRMLLSSDAILVASVCGWSSRKKLLFRLCVLISSGTSVSTHRVLAATVDSDDWACLLFVPDWPRVLKELLTTRGPMENLEIFSAFETESRVSDKGETVERIKCPIAATCNALNRRAVILSHCVYLRDFQRTTLKQLGTTNEKLAQSRPIKLEGKCVITATEANKQVAQALIREPSNHESGSELKCYEIQLVLNSFRTTRLSLTIARVSGAQPRTTDVWNSGSLILIGPIKYLEVHKKKERGRTAAYSANCSLAREQHAGTSSTNQRLVTYPPPSSPANTLSANVRDPFARPINLSETKRVQHGEAQEYKGRGKREIPEKTRRRAASSGMISTCENPGATPAGIESNSPRWEVRSLTTKPTVAPRLQHGDRYKCSFSCITAGHLLSCLFLVPCRERKTCFYSTWVIIYLRRNRKLVKSREFRKLRNLEGSRTILLSGTRDAVRGTDYEPKRALTCKCFEFQHLLHLQFVGTPESHENISALARFQHRMDTPAVLFCLLTACLCGRTLAYLPGQSELGNSETDKIDVKHVCTEVDFAVGSQFSRHDLNDSDPISDLQGNK